MWAQGKTHFSLHRRWTKKSFLIWVPRPLLVTSIKYKSNWKWELLWTLLRLGFLNFLSSTSSKHRQKGKLPCQIAKGIHLLADHHYGLSKARCAFIVPSLNCLAKTASNLATVNEYLFGNNFADAINAAQMIKKVAYKIVKKIQQPPLKTFQLSVKQQLEAATKELTVSQCLADSKKREVHFSPPSVWRFL